MATRVNKYICESGLCSRKAADRHVQRGVVLINGRQAVLGEKVVPGDKVTVDGLLVSPLPTNDAIVIVLNKPTGIVCTAASSERRNIVDFVGHSSRIFPIGRLDAQSQGLIFLTNRCELVNQILSSDNEHEKEYEVTVDKEISDEFLAGLSGGVPMLGVVTKQCTVLKVSTFVFRITLVQGLNRQIRRMCKHFEYKVEKLERIRIMHVKIDGLATGKWRNLADDELSTLSYMLGVAPTFHSVVMEECR